MLSVHSAVVQLAAPFIARDRARAARMLARFAKAELGSAYTMRWAAAQSLMRNGQAAMPYILKALESKDLRVVQAACEAMTGPYGMNGRRGGDLRAIMTPDTSEPASMPPSASKPITQPTRIGAPMASAPGRTISLSAALVEIVTHLAYSGSPVPSMMPGIVRN